MHKQSIKKVFPAKSSWLELNRSAFEHNIAVFRSLIGPKIPLGCVLKGNAYGHGFMESLQILHDLTDIIFLISPLDAFQVRAYEKKQSKKEKRIVVLGAMEYNEAKKCGQQNIEIVVSDNRTVEIVKKYKQLSSKNIKIPPLKIHIHFDTGLGREGFLIQELTKKSSFLNTLKTPSENIVVKGALSHFANTEDVTEQDYALEQINKFNEAVDFLKKQLNLNDIERHFAQSAATMILPNSRFDAVRVGISLYGFWPSAETKISAKVVQAELPVLKPVLSWKCMSQYVRSISVGSFIGYGCSFRAERDLKVALFPVGYYDGYPRLLSNRAHVLVNGKRCKVIGRVMMNHIIVDVTEATHNLSPVVATLVGTSHKETVSIENLADWAQTINYEVVTRIGSHLKRVVIDT